MDKKAFDFEGNLIKQKTGIWLMDMDTNSIRAIEDFGEWLIRDSCNLW